MNYAKQESNVRAGDILMLHSAYDQEVSEHILQLNIGKPDNFLRFRKL